MNKAKPVSWMTGVNDIRIKALGKNEIPDCPEDADNDIVLFHDLESGMTQRIFPSGTFSGSDAIPKGVADWKPWMKK
jgi:hypothetical protein